MPTETSGSAFLLANDMFLTTLSIVSFDKETSCKMASARSAVILSKSV